MKRQSEKFRGRLSPEPKETLRFGNVEAVGEKGECGNIHKGTCDVRGGLEEEAAGPAQDEFIGQGMKCQHRLERRDDFARVENSSGITTRREAGGIVEPNLDELMLAQSRGVVAEEDLVLAAAIGGTFPVQNFEGDAQLPGFVTGIGEPQHGVAAEDDGWIGIGAGWATV